MNRNIAVATEYKGVRLSRPICCLVLLVRAPVNQHYPCFVILDDVALIAGTDRETAMDALQTIMLFVRRHTSSLDGERC